MALRPGRGSGIDVVKTLKCATVTFEERSTKLQIGLKVVSLGPLIPRVHEHQRTGVIVGRRADVDASS
jgi:hypothetical protein